jgi:hypothetical protein
MDPNSSHDRSVGTADHHNLILPLHCRERSLGRCLAGVAGRQVDVADGAIQGCLDVRGVNAVYPAFAP